MQLSDSSLVLIAIMPKLRDFEIARLLGWYRIPMKTAPKILQVDFIAFYQTKDFGDQRKNKVEYYAEVRGVELTTRQALFRDEPDHPRAKEEYYKLQLGPLRLLNQPILAERWKRFLFFYTTGERLFRAKKLRDLAVSGSERELLWRSLQERKTSQPMKEQNQEIPQELLFLLGNLTMSTMDLEE